MQRKKIALTEEKDSWLGNSPKAWPFCAHEGLQMLYVKFSALFALQLDYFLALLASIAKS